MKKIRKGKKILLLLLIAIIAIIAIIFIMTRDNVEEPEIPEVPETPQVITLPETTYSNMQVKNIGMEYLDDNNETMISMDIHNTTESKVEKQKFEAVLIGPNEEILATMYPVDIQGLEVGEVHNVQVIYKGDVTATQYIKLVEK